MKTSITKIILLLFLMRLPFVGHTQNKAIDSLQNILPTQKEDTNKVNTLNALSIKRSEFINGEKAMQCAGEALSLAKQLNFKKGEAAAWLNIGVAYFIKANISEAFKNANNALKLLDRKSVV